MSSAYAVDVVERKGVRARLNSAMREPLVVSFALALTLFVPLLAAEDNSFNMLPSSRFDSSVRSIENTIAMCSTLSLTFPLIVDMLMDLLALRRSDVTFLGYRALSILSILVVTSISLAFQTSRNAASIAITVFCWGLYLEFCVIASFMLHLIPRVFTFRRVVFLNLLLYPSALLPIVYPITSSPHTFIRGLFFISFYSYGAYFTYLVAIWLLSLRRAYVASKLSFGQYLRSLRCNDVCILSLLAGLLLTSVVLLLAFHALIPDFPHVGGTSNGVHLLMDISRSCLCVFTYMIPYRMFREALVEARRDLEIKTEFVKYISHEMRTPVGTIVSCLQLLTDSELALTLNGAPSEELRREIAEMHASAKIALEILDDLLLYEKLERGSIEMRFVSQEPLAALTKLFRYLPVPVAVLPPNPPDAPNAPNADTDDWRIRIDLPKLLTVMNAILSHGAIGAIGVSEETVRHSEADPKLTVQFSMTHTRAPVSALSRLSLSLMAPEPEQRSADLFTVVLCDYRSGAPRAEDYSNLSEERMKFERVGHDDGRGSGFGLWIANRFIALHGATVAARVTECGLGMRIQMDFPMHRGGGEDALLFLAAHRQSEELSARARELARVVIRRKPSVTPAAAAPQRRGSPVVPLLSDLLVDPEVVDQPLLAEPLAAEEPVEPEEKPIRVLVVDDSSTIRRVTIALLRKLGERYSFSEATDGDEAVEAVRESMAEGRPFDVILMDHEMPRMTGSEAATVIRAELRYRGLILGVTGNCHDDDVALFVKRGADTVIPKPLTKERFLQETVGLLGGGEFDGGD